MNKIKCKNNGFLNVERIKKGKKCWETEENPIKMESNEIIKKVNLFIMYFYDITW